LEDVAGALQAKLNQLLKITKLEDIAIAINIKNGAEDVLPIAKQAQWVLKQLK